MRVRREVLRMIVVLVTTCALVALLWTMPWFLFSLMIIPLALSVWFWPYSSTGIAYGVGAIAGIVFTAWTLIESVAAPLGMTYLWSALVWGPAGVLVKRAEVVLVELYRRRTDTFHLPELH